jgi:hypothetical protein
LVAVETRPHVLIWTTAGTAGGEDPESGYPIEGLSGVEMEVPCRFHLGGVRIFRNQDNIEVAQVGTIRLDSGVELPEVGAVIEVLGHYKGKVKDVYRGQLSSRIDV